MICFQARPICSLSVSPSRMALHTKLRSITGTCTSRAGLCLPALRHRQRLFASSKHRIYVWWFGICDDCAELLQLRHVLLFHSIIRYRFQDETEVIEHIDKSRAVSCSTFVSSPVIHGWARHSLTRIRSFVIWDIHLWTTALPTNTIIRHSRFTSWAFRYEFYVHKLRIITNIFIIYRQVFHIFIIIFVLWFIMNQFYQ